MLALSAEGTLLVVRTAGTTTVVRLADRVAFDLQRPGLRAALPFRDQLWLVFEEADGLRIERADDAGRALGEPLRLPGVGADAVVRALSPGAPAAMVCGRRFVEVRLEGGLVARELDGGWEALVPLAAGSFVGRRGGRWWLRTADGERALSLPDAEGAALVDAQPLFGGASALLGWRGERAQLAVLDCVRGVVGQRLPLAGVRAARAVAARGHVLVVGDDGTLAVVDLRFGRTLKQWRERAPVTNVAVDAAGAHVVLESVGPTGVPELAFSSYRQIFGERTSEDDDAEGARVDEPSWSALPARDADPRDADPRDAPTPDDDLRDAAPTPDDDLRDAAPTPALAALAEAPLLALRPRPPLPPLPPDEAARDLDRLLALVRAWCKRAVALAWDSGRLSPPSTTERPFAREVDALLEGAHGGAREELIRAEARVREFELRCLPLLDPAQVPRPLAHLADELALSPLAMQILVIVAAPLVWGELTRAYAIVANDPARPVCDELLVGQLLAAPLALRRQIADELGETGALVRHGLVRVGAGTRPFRALTVPDVVVRRLAGERFDAADPAAEIVPHPADRALDELQLPSETLAALLETLARPDGGSPLRLVLSGRPGSGRRTVLATLAARANRRLGVIDAALLARESRSPVELLRARLQETALRGWLPCVSGLELVAGDDEVTQTKLRELLRAHPGPLALRCEPGFRPPLEPGFVAFELPPLGETARATAWRRALERRALPSAHAELLAARFAVGPGTIERVVRRLPPGDGALLPGLESAVRQHRATRIGDTATRVERLPSWSNVVLPSEIADSLKEFIGRVRHRRTVMERWGMDRVVSSARGLTALFQGGPGTGKSLVAGLIARELGYELYRIDLGRLLSKWIGETERNLGAVFDAAEEGEMVLLFDEADSLFTKRTEVKSSVDRYANVEVNYLLQRLDAFEGVAVMTTNFGSAIDSAFKRRLSLQLTLPFPDEAERAQLWRVHVPKEVPVDGALDFGALAARYKLSGGYIRNAALRATYLAAAEERPLTQEHLERAVKLEYRELGKLSLDTVLE